jgi:dipeptidyl aminopeptidase/acylaminoacyl peptidase
MKRTFVCLLAIVAVVSAQPRAGAPPVKGTHPSMAQFMSFAFPEELITAKKSDRIAWVANDKGLRNVYTAAAPLFKPVRVTAFVKDNGIESTQLSISDDGSTVTFTRGGAPNREGWIPSPEADPQAVAREIWAAKTATPGVAWRLAEGANGVLSPNGQYVAFAKDGQIFRVPTAQAAPRTSDIDKGLKPFIKIWGANSNPVWSPDGKKLAFVTSRTDHSFIAIYDTTTKNITYMSPSTDWDTSPTWSADSKRLAYIKRPGTPFAQQSQPGVGGLGNPAGPAFNPAAPAGRGGGGGGRGGGGRGVAPGGAAAQGRGGEGTAAATQGRGQGRGGAGRGGDAPEGTAQNAPAPRPGLTSATFAGGYTLAFWFADATTGDAKEFWHNAAPADEKVFNNIGQISWHGDHVVFQLEPDEWTRFYSVAVPSMAGPLHNTGPNNHTDEFGPGFTDVPSPAPPTSLTPQDGQIETSDFSEDGKYLYYGTNATDIERRHIWRVALAGGAPEQVTRGDAIEHDPVPLPSGKYIAALTADYNRPQSVGIFAANALGVDGRVTQKVIYPVLTSDFPTAAHVQPQTVLTKAADGMEIHNQLFLPKDARPGEKHPAIIFVHGGPVRQMLPAYHYMEVYHLFYGVNQWLASQGYVVLSVNYRGGIGYGKSFRTAPNTNARGNSEYQDVVAGGKYLQSRPDVDPARVGIWGLSYGGLLTSQALARNSDMFIAGVDLAGVHLYGSSLDPENVAYTSSAISEIDKWKSPVLLIQGDDDRNVNFAQTVGLVDLLRAHKVPYELFVMPDDTHETLLYRRWIAIWDRMEAFLDKNLAKAEPMMHQQQK